MRFNAILFGSTIGLIIVVVIMIVWSQSHFVGILSCCIGADPGGLLGRCLERNRQPKATQVIVTPKS